ncbi:hypothetical protein OIU76_029899, partial [Salix suchowensis]
MSLDTLKLREALRYLRLALSCSQTTMRAFDINGSDTLSLSLFTDVTNS